jgi:hypothetical protein
MSDFRCIAWENRSTSCFFHRYRCVLAFFGKRRTGCAAWCDWKSLHGAGGRGHKNQLAPCHASVYISPLSPGGIGIPMWAGASPEISPPGGLRTPILCRFRQGSMVGLTTSQRSSCCFRQKNGGRRIQFHVGIGTPSEKTPEIAC